MAKPPDRVLPLKFESAAEGGDAADDNMGLPARLNPVEDAISVAGIFAGETGKDGSDELVALYREADKWYFEDTDYNGGSRKSLADLAAAGSGVSEAAHKALRQLIHFIEDGPTDGFTSGAFKETTGTVFPTAEIWYVVGSTPPAGKIVELLTTWTGPVITQEIWKMYDIDGSTVLVTVTDTITYSGIFETSRTRAIA